MDRIQWLSVLIVACFVAVLILPSQSRASYPTYVLALFVITTYRYWIDILQVPLFRWVLLLLVWLALSTTWSQSFVMRDAVSIWIRALLIIGFVVAVAECQLRDQLRNWLGVALASVGVIAVFGALVNFYFTAPEDGRLNGLGQLDTHVIAALVYGFVLVWILRLILNNKHGYLGYAGLSIACFLIVSAVFLSDSRNAWVAVTMGVVVYLGAFVLKDKYQFLAANTVVFVFAIFAFLVATQSDVLREIILPRGDSFRFSIWGVTWDRIVLGSWFLGQGILTSDDIHIGENVFQHPHSMYLSVLYQGGAIGLFIYLVVLVKSLSVLVRNFEKSDAKLALGVFAIALPAHSLDGHELIDKVGDTWFLIWFPIAISIAICWHRPTKIQ